MLCPKKGLKNATQRNPCDDGAKICAASPTSCYIQEKNLHAENCFPCCVYLQNRNKKAGEKKGRLFSSQPLSSEQTYAHNLSIQVYFLALNQVVLVSHSQAMQTCASSIHIYVLVQACIRAQVFLMLRSKYIFSPSVYLLSLIHI